MCSLKAAKAARVGFPPRSEETRIPPLPLISVEPQAESYIDAIARLERDKRHLQSKLDSIQEILQG